MLARTLLVKLSIILSSFRSTKFCLDTHIMTENAKWHEQVKPSHLSQCVELLLLRPVVDLERLSVAEGDLLVELVVVVDVADDVAEGALLLLLVLLGAVLVRVLGQLLHGHHGLPHDLEGLVLKALVVDGVLEEDDDGLAHRDTEVHVGGREQLEEVGNSAESSR